MLINKKYILVFILFAVLIVYLAKVKERKTVPILVGHENQTIQKILSESQEVFLNQSRLDGEIYYEQTFMEWQNQDGWIITSTSAPSVSAFYLCKNSRSPFKKVVPGIYSALDKMFVENTFTVNPQNTMKGYDENKFGSVGYSYTKAYENGNVQCLVSAIPDCIGLPGDYGQRYGSPIRVSCMDNLQGYESEQLPLLRALDIKDDSINDIHYFGNFLKITLRYESIIVSRKNGKYYVIYRGQEGPSCDFQEKYNFPQELKDYLGVPCSQ